MTCLSLAGSEPLGSDCYNKTTVRNANPNDRIKNSNIKKLKSF